MEYYNSYTEEYLKALSKNILKYKFKIEILDHWERTCGEITRDLSSSNKGTINVNYKQGIRRNCSLTMIDVEKKYLPSENSWFWYNRKFKLYIGLVDTENIYWWSQGVYITQSANATQNIVNIEGVDKFALLDGTLKTGILETTYQFPSGCSIRSIILDTLAIGMGNGQPIDPIFPIIDMTYCNQKTCTEFKVDANGSLGDILIELADSYSADIYYNNDGQLVFHNLFADRIVSAYRHLAPQWSYTFDKAYFCAPNFSYQFDGINCVTVCTNTSNLKNVSYTAYNRNPMSPLRIDFVGIKRAEIQEITYIDTAESDMEDRCRQAAEHILLKDTVQKLSISFNSPIIPHLNVNRTISITDEYYNCENQIFVIQSLTIPIGVGEMSVSATNIQWLPDDTEKSGTTYVR